MTTRVIKGIVTATDENPHLDMQGVEWAQTLEMAKNLLKLQSSPQVTKLLKQGHIS